MNKLFCCFVGKDEDLEKVIKHLRTKFDIINNKIFILENVDEGGYICSFSLDSYNISDIPLNTIIVHRKKDTNTLYSINALNTLIESLNEGVLDKNFLIDWTDYKNSLLLTRNDKFYQIFTKLKEIREF
jgi:hypothetical protein